MKNSQKIVFLILMLSVFTANAVDDYNKDRYKGYQFSPIYDDGMLSSETSDLINQLLGEWRYLYKLHGVSRWGDKVVAAYTANIKKKKYAEWQRYRSESLSKGEKYDPAGWSAVSVFNGRRHEKDLIKKVSDLFPSGHYANDYYGCIELRPVFTSQMIEGASNALFVVTGLGSAYSDGILDELILNIYDKNSQWNIRESLFLSNYNAQITKDNKLEYNYYAYSQELPDKHQLSVTKKDNRGRKKYAKLFVEDFNKDGLLEIIFWHRQYYSTLVKETNRNGFVLEKQWFTYYFEEKGKKKFTDKKIDNLYVKKLLDDNDLSWNDGYPKDNKLCSVEGHVSYPMMPLVIDDEIQN